MQALRTGRVNHAYLFSGPRGCGKTTSARILARCLNCEQGPTPTPCGACDSCVALARGGSGSVDVIEIDAASHGGVDDARDLRERAIYGPAASRYKIYIIDEAHMVTPQGFNALLKIVEEPPEHVKFVFATTEPEKVIGTIRSRTHHYPFRLVPPAHARAYMEQLCEAEGVAVAARRALASSMRAGGGSVRDSLSVLDQLIAGVGARGPDLRAAPWRCSASPTASCSTSAVDALAAGDARRGLPPGRPGHRDRARPAPLRRGPARAAARPHHRGRDPGGRRSGAARRARGPARAACACSRRPSARARSRARADIVNTGAHRDDRRHRAAAAARADLRAHPPARPPPASRGMPPASTASSVASRSGEFPPPRAATRPPRPGPGLRRLPRPRLRPLPPLPPRQPRRARCPTTRRRRAAVARGPRTPRVAWVVAVAARGSRPPGPGRPGRQVDRRVRRRAPVTPAASMPRVPRSARLR